MKNRSKDKPTDKKTTMKDTKDKKHETPEQDKPETGQENARAQQAPGTEESQAPADDQGQETGEEKQPQQETTAESTDNSENAPADEQPDEEAVEETPEDKAQAEIRAMEKKLQEMQDKYLRLSAEFDNYRRRTLKEKMEMSKSAGEELLKNLLPVMDNFERAQKSLDDSEDINAVKEGIHLIYNNFKEYLKRNGVREIEALHEAFDTDVHEAMTKIPAPEKKLKGKVVDVIEKGYYLNDKVIRYAKVVVGE